MAQDSSVWALGFGSVVLRRRGALKGLGSEVGNWVSKAAESLAPKMSRSFGLEPGLEVANPT